MRERVKQEVVICERPGGDVARAVERAGADKVFILADTATRRLCLPLLEGLPCLAGAETITVGATDEHKTLATLASVWTALQRGGATRHSLLVNVGGGMVTDLGGMAAATFKRGMAFVNVPTTLLSMVDAAVGGKTGINFGGMKNEVGVFRPASSVVISPLFLATLDRRELLSGYAEMLKHGLLSGPEAWAELAAFDLDKPDLRRLGGMIGRSVAVKERIVEADPEERGPRKALNLGHTAGHALESLALEERRTVPHGYAVAWGLVCELYLSHAKAGFPLPRLRQVAALVKDNYGALTFDCAEYRRLYEFMTHDKKNTAGQVNFTLLRDLGDPLVDQTATREEVMETLDFYRETMGC